DASERTVARHYGEVVFLVVGVVVLTLAPLADRLVVADAHDRRPLALARVVAGGRRAVVAEPEVVTDFVCGSFGDVLRSGHAVGEDPGRLVVVVVRRDVEGADVGDATAATRRVDRVARCDHGAGAVDLVTAARPRDDRLIRLLSGHVDV